MSGTFFHSRAFDAIEYVGGDGRVHFEIQAIDGESLALSNTTWEEMKSHCESLGMPRAAWPEFPEYGLGIDVPIADVNAKQDGFRQYLLDLPKAFLEQHHWLEQIASWVRGGETVFFCGN